MSFPLSLHEGPVKKDTNGLMPSTLLKPKQDLLMVSIY